MTEDKAEIIETNDSFRDQLATVSKEGKRNWIYPKKPSGRFYNARTLVSFLLLVILVGMPFIKINGQQFMLFDFLGRNFILFGIPFGSSRFVSICNCDDCDNCIYYSFYCSFRKSVLRMGLSPDNFYGNGVQED